MAYRLSVFQPVEKEVPVIVIEQLDDAIAKLKAAGRDHRAIHASRKNFKRARALLDLVEARARGGGLKAGRRRLTAAARALAASRDAQVAVETAEALETQFDGPAKTQLFADLISWLRARRDKIGEKLDQDDVNRALRHLHEAKICISTMALRTTGISELREPASDLYRRGRHAMRNALDSRDDEDLHAWRKLTQRHWRHMQLFAEAWPKEAKARAAAARALSDVLGVHHDLAMLRQTILANRIIFRSPADIRTLRGSIEEKQAPLVAEAALLGERLYNEKPKALFIRFDAKWRNAYEKHTGQRSRLEAAA